jgi:type I restriction enzyme M protein
MVKCVCPLPGKTVADPCCGSGGFLLAVKYFLETNYPMMNADEKKFLKF